MLERKGVEGKEAGGRSEWAGSRDFRNVIVIDRVKDKEIMIIIFRNHDSHV